LKPAAFDYHVPATLAEAVALKARLAEQVTVLAGGQSLVPLMNMRLARPPAILDLNRVRELAYIRPELDGLRVGAMTRQRDLERSADARRLCPLAVEALGHVGHSVIRNRGTVGGSIAHADPAAELPAVLVALGGVVKALGPSGERDIAAADFFVSDLQNSLAPDELVVEVRFPALSRPGGFAFLEVARRHGDFALAGVAAVMGPDVTRLSFLGVGSTPVLTGSDPDQAAASVHPRSDIHATAEYRRDIVRVLARRALQVARRRFEEGIP
jgi:aerobic carbon-monoxide dehydrogenase medium subunit